MCRDSGPCQCNLCNAHPRVSRLVLPTVHGGRDPFDDERRPLRREAVERRARQTRRAPGRSRARPPGAAPVRSRQTCADGLRRSGERAGRGPSLARGRPPRFQGQVLQPAAHLSFSGRAGSTARALRTFRAGFVTRPSRSCGCRARVAIGRASPCRSSTPPPLNPDVREGRAANPPPPTRPAAERLAPARAPDSAACPDTRRTAHRATGRPVPHASTPSFAVHRCA